MLLWLAKMAAMARMTFSLQFHSAGVTCHMSFSSFGLAKSRSLMFIPARRLGAARSRLATATQDVKLTSKAE